MTENITSTEGLAAPSVSEWGVRYPSGNVEVKPEGRARLIVERYADVPNGGAPVLMTREVTEWREVGEGQALPPLTAEDFEGGAGYTFRGVPLIEGEDGDDVYAYGHVDAGTFAGAVDDFYREVGAYDEPTDPEDVDHRYAVTIAGPPNWLMKWADVTAETPGAFPITMVSR